MTHLNFGNATPQTVEEIAPGARPLDAAEQDYAALVPDPETGKMISTARRLRIIRMVSADQTKVHSIVKDLGPPTGEDGIYIPCDGAVEMAQVNEMLDAAIIRRKERMALRAKLLPTMHERQRLGLLEYAEKALAAKKGRQF